MNTDLIKHAKEIRKKIILMANRSKGPHVGSALSCVDILAALYFKTMTLEPWAERDVFILSKAHSAMALYGALAEKGIIDKKILDGYYQNNGSLPAHLDKFTAKGVEISAGSLGHGFNIGLGMAYGLKMKKSAKKVYVLMGDGETQEGSIWEGALFAPKLMIDNFTAIIDVNNLQGYGRPTDLCCFESIRAKWESFGWLVLDVDGHNLNDLTEAFKVSSQNKPKIIIARTIKGKGVSFMEDQLVWHYYVVTDALKEKALEELA